MDEVDGLSLEGVSVTEEELCVDHTLSHPPEDPAVGPAVEFDPQAARFQLRVTSGLGGCRELGGLSPASPRPRPLPQT